MIKPLIVACIPAYNEEETIAKVIVQVQKYVDEVMVCDDGSSDLTGEIAEKLGAKIIRHRNNLGKGEALRDLFKNAQDGGADIIVTLDADGQHDPHDIISLVKPIRDGKADIVIGNRGLDESPIYRRLGRTVLDRFTGVKEKTGQLLDTQSGFRAFSKRAVEMIEVVEPGFAIESEMLMKARDKGLMISKVSIKSTFKEGEKNILLHGLEVIGGILTLIGIKHPIVFVGVPGLIMAAIGIYGWTWVAERFEMVGELPLGHALIYTIILLIGVFAMFIALALFTLTNFLKRYKM